ncbi:TPA: RelA/SpoT domain-containing protein, partial [Enterobacter cloacae]|nr:RelA/SpoT domain-containing protein [Enterobacter cloacae]
MNEEELESEYKKTVGAIDDFRKNVFEQLSNLIISSQVPLGINLESRVKDWLSIRNKIERKELKIITIHDISDLIGFRIILLFKRDLDVVSDIIKKN